MNHSTWKDGYFCVRYQNEICRWFAQRCWWRVELGLGMIKVRAKSKILARTFLKDWKQPSLKALAEIIIYVCWKIAAATQKLLSAAGRPLLSALGLPPIQSSHLCVLVQCIFYTYWERVQTCLYYVVQCAFYIFSVWVWYIVLYTCIVALPFRLHTANQPGANIVPIHKHTCLRVET